MCRHDATGAPKTILHHQLVGLYMKSRHSYCRWLLADFFTCQPADGTRVASAPLSVARKQCQVVSVEKT